MNNSAVLLRLIVFNWLLVEDYSLLHKILEFITTNIQENTKEWRRTRLSRWTKARRRLRYVQASRSIKQSQVVDYWFSWCVPIVNIASSWCFERHNGWERVLFRISRCVVRWNGHIVLAVGFSSINTPYDPVSDEHVNALFKWRQLFFLLMKYYHRKMDIAGQIRNCVSSLSSSDTDKWPKSLVQCRPKIWLISALHQRVGSILVSNPAKLVNGTYYVAFDKRWQISNDGNGIVWYSLLRIK